MRSITIIAILLTANIACAQDTQRQTVFGSLDNMVLSTGSGRIRIMDQSGTIRWSYAAGNAHDCWMLSGGNILFADGQIKEVNPNTNEVVWQYKPKDPRNGDFSCQRLSGGVTLVGENSTGRILEVDKDGKIVFQMQVQPFREGDHHNIRMVRKLNNGNYLVCHSGEHVVREHTPKGEIVFEVKVDNIAFSAVRLDNGNTLVGHIDHITEFNPRGEEVWNFSNEDIEGVVITWMCDIHVLPNGHIAVGVYRAYNKDRQGNGLFEITRDKQLVWRYSNPDVDGNMMGIQVLAPDGKPLPGDPLR
jgi:outer membrane protein assembly factor BamB